MSLPRLECIAAAAVMRAFGQVPDPATPFDYERVLRPVYGLSYSVAQSELAQRATRPSERAWRTISGRSRSRGRVRRALRGAAIGAGVPATVSGINRLLHSDFEPTLTAEAIAASGVDAATELAERLGVGGGHLITGHTHRGGPGENDGEWALPRRRLAAQHRQLDLRLRLPSPRDAARPLLARNRHLGRGRWAAAAGPAPRRQPPRGLAEVVGRQRTRREP